MAVRSKFTRIPKVHDLILAGVPTEAIPTYCALADYSNNKTGLCWPKMETLALRLNRSVRTIQRHLHLLKECGLIEFVERRRCQGRFSSYLYRILHIVKTTGHSRPVKRERPNKRRTRPVPTTPKVPKRRTAEEIKEGYWWLFGEKLPGAEEEYRQEAQKKREEAARRRREGFEWLF